MYNKGAMFGLDARIALAIFGALSVISGAALYSAIQESRVTALMTETNEVAKAVEQYLLDVGSLPPISTTHTRNLDVSALLVKPSTGADGWKGPYMSLEKASGADFFNTNNYGMMGVPYRTGMSWTNSGDDTCKQSSANCYIYVEVQSIPLSIQKSIESKLDGTTTLADSDVAGNFRYSKGGWSQFKKDIPFDPANSPTP
jgi:type II secretory pathway pseudopilin PulG